MNNLIPVPIKKLRDNIILPTYAHGLEDSGMDVYVAAIAVKQNNKWVEYDDCYTIKPMETVIVKTGIAMAIPIHMEVQVRPTSGNSLKTTLRVANAPGTIDAGYRDEIGVIVTNIGDEGVAIFKDDKIAQLVLAPVYHISPVYTDDLPSSDRGIDGYGSTGVVGQGKSGIVSKLNNLK